MTLRLRRSRYGWMERRLEEWGAGTIRRKLYSSIASRDVGNTMHLFLILLTWILNRMYWRLWSVSR
jgi:hypothetical protein